MRRVTAPPWRRATAVGTARARASAWGSCASQAWVTRPWSRKPRYSQRTVGLSSTAPLQPPQSRDQRQADREVDERGDSDELHEAARLGARAARVVHSTP